MTIVLIILAVALTGVTVTGVICYRKFAVPSMLPLAEQDLELCREIVSRGQGLPWVCRHALKTGLCPCQPCEKLKRARVDARERPEEPIQGRAARRPQQRTGAGAPRLSRERRLELWVDTLR